MERPCCPRHDTLGDPENAQPSIHPLNNVHWSKSYDRGEQDKHSSLPRTQ